MKLGLRLLFASGALVLLTIACVGGPGQLPDDQGQTGQQGGTGNPTTTTPPTTSGSGSTTGSGGATGSSSSTSGSGTNVKRSIAGNEFNQTCSGDSATECIAVFFGSTCSPCQCPNGAINNSDGEKYKNLLSERTEGCAIPDIACSPCRAVTPICVANTCQITTASSSPDAG